MGWETVAIARELTHSGNFANPFEAGPSGPTAIIPPLYPIYLACLLEILGDTPAFALTASLLAVAAQALHAALLPRISLLLLGESMPGIFAGLLSALAFRLMPQWDAAFTSCAVLLFLLCSSLVTRQASALTGAAVGLLLLTNPSTALIAGPWLVVLYLRQRVSPARIALMAAVAVFVTIPWVVRNHIALDTWSIKDNLGYTAFAANSDCAVSGGLNGPAGGCVSERNPNKNPDELAQLIRLGEAKYDSQRARDTIRWVQGHPASFVHLTASRVAAFWFPQRAAPAYTVLTIWFATALSVPGLLLLFRHDSVVTGFLMSVTALYPLLYYLVAADVRYRYPILWVSLLGAGYLVTRLTKRKRDSLLSTATTP